MRCRSRASRSTVARVDAEALADRLPDLLDRCWRLAEYEVVPIPGGMNSVVVEVRLPARRYVAKWVPLASRTALEAGGPGGSPGRWARPGHRLTATGG